MILHLLNHSSSNEKALTFYYREKGKCIFSDGFIGPSNIAKGKHLLVNHKYVCLVRGHRVLSVQWPEPSQQELFEKRLML